MRLRCSYFHTPTLDGRYRHIFHSVLRAAWGRVAPDYRLESWLHPGHDLLLSLAGSGSVQIGNRTFQVDSGELVWIDYNHSHPHVRWPSRSQPWEYLFVRVDSAQLDLIAEALNVEANPLFTLPQPAAAVRVFKRIFRLLHARSITMDAALHAAVSALIAILFEARQSGAAEKRPELRFDKVLNAMRAEYRRPWRVKELAQLMNCSVPQFYRQFNQATGAAPMNWLRRERINQAKRRLIETNDPIGQIAADVGYDDPLYFSRDFKKLVGIAPRDYRRRE